MRKFALDFIRFYNSLWSRMVIDIAAHISLLLYQNDAVVLPGLGRLSSTYKPASLDHIHGVIHPPAKTIHFEEDLESDNDSMLQSLAEKHHINATQAEILVHDYIDSVRNALSFQEEVDIPKVGKLYKDYEQQVRFIAYDTNFNSTSFGLPQLNYLPIVRNTVGPKALLPAQGPLLESNQEVPAILPSNPSIPPKPPGKQTGASGARWIWLVPVILAILVAVLAIRWYGGRQEMLAEAARVQAAAAADQRQVPDLGNKSVEQDNVLGNSEMGRSAAAEMAILPEQTAAAEESIQAESPVTKVLEPVEGKAVTAPKKENRSSKTKQCIIISGVFKNVVNQQQLAKTLAARGFEVYKDQRKGLFRVGVQFSYSNSADLASNINSVKNFAPGSWVYKK